MNGDNNRASSENWEGISGERIPSSLRLYSVFFRKAKQGQKIVDIGCGFGKICLELLAKSYGPVVGFDINKNGIALANERLESMPLVFRRNCRFEVRDALASGYKDECFDVGIMQALLTTITNPTSRLMALKEARRIIRRSGGLYLGVFMQTWHSEKYLRRYEQGERETGERGSFLAYDPSTGKLQYQAHHYSEQEIVYLLRDADFHIASFQYRVFKTRSGNSVNGAVIWAV